MKKIISCILSLIISFGCLSLISSAIDSKGTVVSANTPCTIIIPVNATEQELYASETLQKYIKEISGITVPVSNDSAAKNHNEIALGNTNRKTFDTSELSDGGYFLEFDNGTLYISGNGARGNIYGVFGFLEKYCNCRWYTSSLKVIPTSKEIIVPVDMYEKYNPYFESTDTDWISPRDSEYSLANNLNGGIYRSLTPAQGGTVNYISGFAHTLTGQFCSANKYFEEHPEYFALRDGERVSDQLCLTNPDVLKIVTGEVLALIEQLNDKSQSLQIVSLTQNDNRNYCTCDNCAAVDKENDSQSGSMITFANAVARSVKAAGYDNVAIDTFAYQYTRQAPSAVTPEDNVIVRLCSIECCFGHALCDAKCDENVQFMQDLEAWNKICNRIYVWDYATNYYETLNIFPDFGVLQQNMQTYFENNVKGMYVEGNYYMASCDGEFGELRSYLLSALMKNPYMDYYTEMDNFLKAYYGDSWEYIREFIDITAEKGVTSKKHLHIFQKSVESLPGMKLKDIKYCDRLWEKAISLAQTDEHRKNILRSEICWRYWKCTNDKSEFSIALKSLYQRMRARELLYNDLVSFGIKMTGESSVTRLTECSTSYLLRRANKWNTIYDENIWFLIEPAVVYFYNIMKAFHNDII